MLQDHLLRHHLHRGTGSLDLEEKPSTPQLYTIRQALTPFSKFYCKGTVEEATITFPKAVNGIREKGPPLLKQKPQDRAPGEYDGFSLSEDTAAF